MPYCSICKVYAEYEDDLELADQRYVHESCLLTLRIRKDALETAMRQQKAQLIQ